MFTGASSGGRADVINEQGRELDRVVFSRTADEVRH
jgi:hypothetical protein